MKKTIRKIGNSLGIIFNQEEQRINNIKEGDVIDMDDIQIIKGGKKRNEKKRNN